MTERPTHLSSIRRPEIWTGVYLLLFGLAWWCIFSFTRHALDHADMVENYVWGTAWQWGNNKHPPLFAWITAAWFRWFPTRDSAYYLLEEANLVLAFWLLALAMRRCMDWSRVLIGIVLTTLVTVYGPDSGFKYNANTAQLPFIAGFIWSLLHGLQSHRRRWFVLTGAFAGAALLCKYSAALLLMAIAGTLVLRLRPPRSIVMTGAMLSSAVAALLLAPHVLWSIRHGWPSLHYMESAHPAQGLTSVMTSHLAFLVSALLYMALPAVVWALARRQLPHRAGPMPDAPRLGLPLLLSTLTLTLAGALISGMTPVSSWLIPVMLFAGWALVDRIPAGLNLRPMAARTLALAMVCLGLYGALAVMEDASTQHQPAPQPYVLQQTMAETVARIYRQRYGQPLDYVAGSFPLPYFVAFYAPEHPQAAYGLDLRQSTWLDAHAFRQGGKAVICGSVRYFAQPPDPDCAAQARRQFGPSDEMRWLRWPVYDPATRRQALQTIQLLMWAPTPSHRQTAAPRVNARAQSPAASG
ncbi:glycosyltransferase family 39 protein [Thermomonas sp.]|uniref:glycosyltransferase family 39 protein n=1 Tax=Thermomonas sp. TaxID=1971895 RepID=UPI00391B98F1